MYIYNKAALLANNSINTSILSLIENSHKKLKSKYKSICKLHN